MKNCVRCGVGVQCAHEVENCRLSGDAYGVECFSCPACGWSASFEFDEADAAYFFETSSWER